MTGAKSNMHKYMAIQCSKLVHSKVSSGFLRQDLLSSYNFGKIQNVGGSELSEEKNKCFIGERRKISCFLFFSIYIYIYIY